MEFLGKERRIRFTDEEKRRQWEFTIKMYCIIKDLIQGNPNLPEEFKEEMVGHNAIAAGFQGQRQWTDHWPNCDYPEAVLNSSFDFEGTKEPMVFATENDVLNGLGMLFMELLTNRAQIFADVRTYWSPEATKRVTGYDLEGKAKDNGGIIHLLNSGAACLDACGECTDEDGNAVMKRWWEVTDEDIKKMTDATVWCEAGFDNFRGGGFSSHFVTRAEMPVTMIRLNLVKGLGPVLQIAEGWTVRLPDEVTDTLMERTNPTWPCTWFAPRCDGKAGSEIKGQSIDSLNIVGGGSRNRLLNQFAADATGCRVITGPIEGAAMGNLLVQAMALGDLKDIHALREVVGRSVKVETYMKSIKRLATLEADAVPKWAQEKLREALQSQQKKDKSKEAAR